MDAPIGSMGLAEAAFMDGGVFGVMRVCPCVGE